MKDGFIYLIRNKTNGKCYVGKTVDIKRRYNEHIRCKPDYPIHIAICNEGIDNFEFIELEHITEEDIERLNEKLNELEISYIKQYNSYFSGYNATLGGDGTAGSVRSDATRKLMSESKKGSKNPTKRDDVKKRISSSVKKYHQEHPQVCSEETRKKISESHLGKLNPMYGRCGKLNPMYGVDWTQNISPKKYAEFCDRRSKLTSGSNNPMYGKSAMKGKHYPKMKWVDECGGIHEMSILSQKRYHPNWKPYVDP